jgi:LAO/AO transport system kinase
MHQNPAVKRMVPRLEREVRAGSLTATLAAQRILDALER